MGKKLFAFKNRSLTQKYIRKYKNQIINPENLIVNNPACIILDKKSQINLNDCLELNANCEDDYQRSTILRMAENSRIDVNGYFKFYFGADIQLFKGGNLILGKSFINSNCKIRCANKITIGDDCTISHDVTILDSDFHKIISDDFQVSAPVTISNHVWIGTRCLILKGVTIGEGAVIGSGSVVTHDVSPHTLVAGCPAKVIKTNVEWRK